MLLSRAAAESAWFTRTWQTEEGLPDNIVSGIVQDRNGFLWVGTFSGVARFDGLQFRALTAENSGGMADLPAHAILLDRRGRLWVASPGGTVSCLDGTQRQVFKPGDNARLIQRARQIAEDSQGTIWVYYDSQQLYRIREGRMEEWRGTSSLPGRGAWQLANDKDGQLWYFHLGQVGVVRGGEFVTLLSVPGPVRIAGARAGGIWISVDKDLCRFIEGGTIEKITTVPVSQSEPPSVLHEDRQGMMWVGTRQAGLFRCTRGVSESVMPARYEIWCVTEDRQGTMWVGTRGGGLSRLQPRVVELQDVLPGEAIEAVTSMSEDASGTIWAAAGNAGNEWLARRRGGSWELVSSNADWAFPRPLCVATTPEGGLWVGTRTNGVFYQDPGQRFNLRQADGLASDYIRSVLVAGSGEVWIGSDLPAGLHRWRNGNLKSFPLSAKAGRVTAMTADVTGTFWATTLGGHLLQIQEDVFQVHALPVAASDEVRCLCPTADGSLWIGCAGQGVIRWNKGRIRCYGTQQGLLENSVAQIVADLDGRLWFAGSHGLFCVPHAEFDALDAGQLTQVHCRLFGRDYGVPALQPNKTYWPGALRTKEGRIWIPTLTGVAAINPAALVLDRSPLPVVAERILVDGVAVAEWAFHRLSARSNAPSGAEYLEREERLVLPPGQHRVEFQFTALECVSPETVMFEYRLEGLDEKWINAGTSREAVYSHIPPGHYRFRVMVAGQDTMGERGGGVLSVVASPYYWETFWFRAGVISGSAGLFAGALVWGQRRRYQRKLERLQQREALERERARIAQDLHDDLGAGLVEIGFGGELAQDPSLAPEEVREHAREISSRAKEMVTALDEIVWAINPKHDDVPSLATYFCQYAQHFLKPTPVQCHLEVARNLPPSALSAEQRHSLFMAFKEALSNVVQHSGARDVWLTISAEGTVLQLLIRDNGCGFDPAAPIQHATADGLGNMRNRLQQLGGRCEFRSTPGQGATAAFMVPLQPAAGRPVSSIGVL